MLKCNSGMIFNESENFDSHVLSAFRVKDKTYACLIDNVTGNRWNEPVIVNDMFDLTKHEAELIFDGFARAEYYLNVYV